MEKIHIKDILPPARNYRSRIDQERLESLAVSIRDRGILQNLLVVAAQEHAGKYRVVAGERRFRAVQMAIDALEEFMAAVRAENELSGQLSDLEARRNALLLLPVRLLTDEEAAEAEFIQLVENLQREEVPLVDEIRVISSWVSDRGMDVTDIAAKLGVDREWVRRRNQLGLCPPPMMRALEEGRVTMKTALLVCSVPDEARRLEFAARVLHPIAEVMPLDERRTRAMLEADYLLPLKDTPWINQGPMAGLPACSGCPHVRTLKAGPMCSMAGCYGSKARHVFALEVEEGGYSGPIDAVDAAKIFTGPAGRVDPAADWLDLAEDVPSREVGHYGSVKWRKWIEDELGQKVETVARVYLALHPATYQSRELVGKSAIRILLKAAAKTKGKDEAPEEQQGDPEPEDEDAGAQQAEGSVDVAAPGWDEDELGIYRGLFNRVVEAEKLAPALEQAGFLRRVLGALLMNRRPAEVRQWAEICGLPFDGDGARGAVHEVRQVHPELLPGLLSVACVLGRPEDASAAEAELAG